MELLTAGADGRENDRLIQQLCCADFECDIDLGEEEVPVPDGGADEPLRNVYKLLTGDLDLLS